MTEALAASPDSTSLEIPIVPLRDAVVFPRTMQPLAIGRGRALRALEALERPDDRIALFLQKDPRVDEPSVAQLRGVGVLARVLRAEMAEGEHLLLVAQGLERVRLVEGTQRDPYLRARVEPIGDVMPSSPDPDFVPLVQGVRELASEVVIGSPLLSNDLVLRMASIEEPARLADFVASFLPFLPTETRQDLLETADVRARLRRVHEELIKERDNLRARRRIELEIEQRLGKAQHELFLREQLKAIQRELGESDEAQRQVDELRGAIEAAGMPDAVKAEATRELDRFAQIPTAAAEHAVARTYLDWLASLPWSKTSAQPIDVARAQRILDEDHYDLEKVKERIVEYLAVQMLRADAKGPILCFVGPPGVGKTSVGKSIARATGRAFVRVSLGGTRDEAEIRGHRRTYVGALPGQILQGIRRAGTRDPVFMLDEIDKLGQDFRGDPAAALMEVLDPEQNVAFRDHYLDAPFDLSRVMFITTANVLEAVPGPLRDRMEVIELPGYAETEKLAIAKQYLVPRQLREHGLEGDRALAFDDDALRAIARDYTREAGLRGLERSLGAICRKHARDVAAGGPTTPRITADVVRARLGAPRYRVETELAERTRRPGVAVAVAWTPQGGDVLFVETARMPRDRGDVMITGHVGEVMQESVRAAWSWVRANAERLAIPSDAFRRYDVHVHVPAGAVPKDGPSAGLVMVAALASLFTDAPLRPFVALTGEITLTGRVLPVGGIKEKVLAARRSGVREIVLPLENEPDVLEEVRPELREGILFRFVSRIEEALDAALTRPQGRGATASARDGQDGVAASPV